MWLGYFREEGGVELVRSHGESIVAQRTWPCRKLIVREMVGSLGNCLRSAPKQCELNKAPDLSWRKPWSLMGCRTHGGLQAVRVRSPTVMASAGFNRCTLSIRQWRKRAHDAHAENVAITRSFGSLGQPARRQCPDVIEVQCE